MRITLTVLIFLALCASCSAPVAGPPTPSTDRMQADLANTVISYDPGVEFATGQFAQFPAQVVRSTQDAMTYRVDFGLPVKLDETDYGACTGTLMMSYTNAGQGWALSSVQPADKLLCPKHDVDLAAAKVVQDERARLNTIQLNCLETKRLAIGAIAESCLRSHDREICSQRYTSTPECAPYTN
jgi:hypothetical protein